MLQGHGALAHCECSGETQEIRRTKFTKGDRMSMRHPFETDLALYAGRDLAGWKRFATAWHVRSCADCRASVESFRDVQQQWSATVDDLPEDIEWDKLSAEMTANVHLGIAAGECVATARERAAAEAKEVWNWHSAAIVAGLIVVFAAAWWLNMPPRTTQVFGNVWNKALHPALTVNPYSLEDRGRIVAASFEGIESSENGNLVLGANMEEAPESVSVSLNGSASARYVNKDTGVVTIATVYGQ
jgi:hypothetical protein